MSDMTKNCKNCQKAISDLRKSSFCNVQCYKKFYYLKNKEKIDKINIDRYHKNKVKYNPITCANCKSLFVPSRLNKIFCSQNCSMANWRNKNKQLIKLDQKKRYKNDIQRKISLCLRSRLNKALKNNVKSMSTISLLGCSINQLRRYLESKFQPGMNWNNYGIKGWHIDHIKPLSSFNLSKKEELQAACHYTNLQPLWWQENLIKGNKYDETQR